MAQPFYTPGQAFDEMYDPASAVRDHYGVMHERLTSLSAEDLNARQSTLERSFLLQGITFTVYGAEAATERIIPTDLIPRIIPAVDRRLPPRVKPRAALHSTPAISFTNSTTNHPPTSRNAHCCDIVELPLATKTASPAAAIPSQIMSPPAAGRAIRSGRMPNAASIEPESDVGTATQGAPAHCSDARTLTRCRHSLAAP